MEAPTLFPDLSIEANANRVPFLEFVYLMDERDHPDHPLHCKYTGLADRFRNSIGEILMTSIIEDWDQYEEQAYSSLAESMAHEAAEDRAYAAD